MPVLVLAILAVTMSPTATVAMDRRETTKLRTAGLLSAKTSDGAFTAEVHRAPISRQETPGRWLQFPDTNAYLAPPASTGRVMYNGHENTYTKYYGNISYGVYDSRYFSAHGYASFDLGAFPDSADILSAEVCYYQYDCGSLGGGTPNTDVVLVPSVNIGAEQLFSDIEHGIALTGRYNTANGWIVRSLNSTGVEAVDSCRRRGEAISLGVRGGWCPYGAAYGAGPFHPERAYLSVTYATAMPYCDVVALGAALDSFPCVVGRPTLLSAWFTNTGNQTAYGIPVYAICNGAALDTLLVDSLPPNDTVRVGMEFPVSEEPEVLQLHVVCYLPLDWCRHNDTVVFSTYAFPGNTRHAEGFEPVYTPSFPPAGWAIHNGGGQSTTWELNELADRYAHTGRHYAVCGDDNTCDDWLITYGLAPRAGIGDTVGLFFRSRSYYYHHDFLHVWALGSQNPHDILGLLLDTVCQSTSWGTARLSIDAYDGQVVYIGFRKYFSGRPGVCLDDIWFTSERAVGIEDISGSMPWSEVHLEVAPNPVARPHAAAIQYWLPREGTVMVTVTDVAGRVVERQSVPQAPKNGVLPLNVGRMAAGVYLVTLRAGTRSVTSKLVVQ